MEIKVYVFDFADGKEFNNIDFEDYAKEMIFKRFCKPFLIFTGVSDYRFNKKDFVEQVNKGVQKLIRDYYTQGVDMRYHFTVYRVVNSMKVSNNEGLVIV